MIRPFMLYALGGNLIHEVNLISKYLQKTSQKQLPIAICHRISTKLLAIALSNELQVYCHRRVIYRQMTALKILILSHNYFFSGSSWTDTISKVEK